MNTPFSEYKATELPRERLNQYFVEPRYIEKMYSNDVAFIIGQRGTGKTTMLKYLCEKYNNAITETKRIGIYYRFDVNKMHSFSGQALSDEEWEHLFAHCFSTEICVEITRLMIMLKRQFNFQKESIICKKIARQFFVEDVPLPETFEELEHHLDDIEYVAKKYKRNPLRAEPPIFSECEKTFEEYTRMITQEVALKNVCFHFLFDEYENMLGYQKRFINSCAKNASGNHTYKICVRPGGNNDMRTLAAQEHLREADDFKTLDYIKDVLGDGTDIEEFMSNACKKRLERYYLDSGMSYTDADLNIKSYFPDKKSDEEYFSDLEKNKKYVSQIRHEVQLAFHSLGAVYDLSWNLLQMKLFLAVKDKRGFEFESAKKAINSKDATYRNWLNNYKKTILYQCYLETGRKYSLSGFEDVINIAGKVLRYVLEICDYCFLCTSCSSEGKYLAISSRMQTDATYRVSERRFKQISTIPDYGQEIKQMVLAIGTIFNLYHRDNRIKRFETNHFSIRSYSGYEEKYVQSQVNTAMQLAVMYGVFDIERSTKITGGNDVPIENEDFHIHPILTPYFQISWRKKQKCRFDIYEMNTFLFGSDEQVTKILSKYYAEIKRDNKETHNEQISFVDIKEKSY